MLNKIDLNKLKIFYFVYSTTSISKSSTILNVTPSAISQQLKKLEEEIGLQLFTRLHKKLVPTSEAKTLYQLTSPFLANLQAELHRLVHGRLAPCGQLTIGLPVELGKMYLPPLIASFRKSYPEVTFALVLGSTGTLLQQVAEGELSFALIDLFSKEQQALLDSHQFSISPLCHEEIILACSKNYFATHLAEDLSCTTLLHQDFVSYDHKNTAIQGWFQHHFGRMQVKVRTVLTVDSMQALVNAIVCDLGLGIITADQAQRRGLYTIRGDKKEIINTISLATLQQKTLTFTEKTFLAYLREHLLPPEEGNSKENGE